MAASKKAVRELTILKRAEVKKASRDYSVQPGDLIFLVKNDTEDVHVVTCRNNGKNSCTCKGNAQFGRTCYHITFCVHNTNFRRESAAVAPEFGATRVPMWTLWLIEAGVLIVPSKVIQLPAKAKPIESAPLNGAQQAAGLLSILPSRQKLAS